MSEILNERKEKLLKFFKIKFEWLQYIALMIIIWIGWTIRAQPISRLIDSTTGKYISIELDSTLYLRYAEYIAEHGKIFALDILRYSPFGASVDITVFSSYFVAYVYRIIHFLGSSATIELVNNYYPLIAMVITTFFLFLFVRRMFDWRVGLLAALLINVIPSFLFRSMGGSSDHDILGIMFVVMALYFYLLAVQSKRIKFNILFGSVAGGLGVLGLLTAGSINFFFMTASVFILFEIILNKFNKNDLAVLTSFLLVFTVLLVGMGRNSLSSLAISFTTGLFYLDLIVGLFYLYVYKAEWVSNFVSKHKFLKYIPAGAFSFIFCFVALILLYTLFFGTGFLTDRFAAFSKTLFKSFSLTRWVLTVAENRRPYVEDWFGQYGKLMVYAFMFGTVALFYDAVKNSRRAKYLTGGYAIFIFLYVFSRYSGNSQLNGESGLSHLLFFGSLILFSLGILIYYFYTYYAEKEEFEALTRFDKKHNLLLIWSIIMILIATSAIRFLFEFTLIIVVLSSYFIIYVIDSLLKLSDKNKIMTFITCILFVFFFIFMNIKIGYEILLFLLFLGILTYLIYYSKYELNYIKLLGVVFFLLILFSPFAFAKGIVLNYYKVSDDSAKYAGMGYNQQWQYAGKWVRENTPSNAVFAHWWDYGYWVQSGFERATVTDGGNFFGWWNYLMGRNVLTSTVDSEALGYLYTHNVTYLLIVADEVGKYPAYSSIGSDQSGDRYSYIPTFNIDPNLIKKTRDETLYYFTGAFGLDEDIKVADKILPKGGAYVAAVVLPIIEGVNNGTQVMSFKQPRALVIYQGQQYELPMRCFYFDRLYQFENYSYGGCFRMFPIINGNQMNQFAAGLFLSNKVSRSTIGRYYLLNQPSDNFKLVYDDTNLGVTISQYNNNFIGPIKIWEVVYPKNFSLTKQEREYYLSTNYLNESLLDPF